LIEFVKLKWFRDSFHKSHWKCICTTKWDRIWFF